MQANGAEMLRIACCLATERGVEVCAPIHDAVLICAPLDRLDEDVARMRAAMAEASRAVLAGFELGTDVVEVHYPERYMDPRRRVMWDRVSGPPAPRGCRGKETAGMTGDPFNEFALTDQDVTEKRAVLPRKIEKRRRQFVMLPMTWRERLAGATGQTVLLAWDLLYLGWKAKGPVTLANGMLRLDGISRYSKWRGLNDLERRGLITVERRPGRSRIVTLLRM